LLFEILNLGPILDIYDESLFKEYLEMPRNSTVADFIVADEIDPSVVPEYFDPKKWTKYI
jgi:hypothetical protein